MGANIPQEIPEQFDNNHYVRVGANKYDGESAE